MPGLTFFAERGQVYMADGPWSARLNQTQCDVLLDLWDEVGAVSSFNALYDAVQAAGYLPPVLSRKSLRLVVNNSPQDVVRQMLSASVEDLLAARKLEQQP